MKQTRAFILLFTLLLCRSLSYAQDSTQTLIIDSAVLLKANITGDTVKKHSPRKAIIRSAILPGWGQAYNKKYWKIPIVYGALATSLYFYAENNQLYHEFRDVYKRRLEGYTDDKYQGIYTDNVIINAQKTYQRNRDLSLLITFGIYALNIIDANVDAHLIQFNVNEKLSVKPDVKQNFFDNNYNVGLTLNYNF